MTKNKEYISIGKILNFHGVQGEAKVGYTKNQADFLKSLESAFIYFENEYKLFKIKSVRFNNKYALIKFDGINSINDILVYKGCILYVLQDDFENSLEDGEYLVDDLVGMDVYSNGKKIGVVVGVSSNGANDLLSVRGISKKISLVPFVDAIVPEVDMENKKVIINEIPGLIE
ncbi:16S rRNA processing protein RimM [bacterium]|nr:16S rRNA processing protein RimM [bacterium]